ncbi:MAG: DUF6671 family protein [Chitinophagales bacterium]
MFQHREVWLATKHRKEEVVAPVLEEAFQMKIRVPDGLDTDTLGTFSGEVPRPGDPVQTLRMKCQMVLDQFGGDLALASEGSFGAHPQAGFVPVDEEWMMLLDTRNEVEIVVRELSMETNFNASDFVTESELMSFAKRAHFPTHGLILKGKDGRIVKGIADQQMLMATYRELLSGGLPLRVETDMRAMYNPTRMQVIKTTARKLVQQMQSVCKQCGTPGYGVVRSEMGLPCEWCSQPTKAILAWIYQCKKCGIEERQLFPQGKQTENPMYCDSCNP